MASSLPRLCSDFSAAVTVPPAAAAQLSRSVQEVKAIIEPQSSSFWARLKNSAANTIDNNRAYIVPKQIQADTITLERFPYIKVTTDLTATSRDGLASDAPAAVRNREVWVKLDKESYDHLVDMAVHYPVLQDHTQGQLVSAAREKAVKASGLAGRFNFEATGILKFPTAEYKGMDISHIADQIRIEPTTSGQYIKPVSGDNRVLADGEFVEGTAAFTGFTPALAATRDIRAGISHPFTGRTEYFTRPADFGLRTEGLSSKTRNLASIRNPMHIQKPPSPSRYQQPSPHHPYRV